MLGDRYLLVRRIAVGGMGEVWEASDAVLGRPVAVKVLREELRAEPTFLERFRAEARHAGSLGHAGIATVYDYGENGEVAYLVMELVRGRPLSELLLGTELSAIDKVSIVAQAAEALEAAHRAGVVHRDVKPGNLMVRPDGTVKVTDFGIARARASAALTEAGQMVGTPTYVSPEQAAGGEVTGASDVYSLGVVAYELFAGRPPFQRDTPMALTLAHVQDPPPPLPSTTPAGVAGLIGSMLAKDPAHRPASAAVVAERLRQELATLRSAPTVVVERPRAEGRPTALWSAGTGGAGSSATAAGPAAPTVAGPAVLGPRRRPYAPLSHHRLGGRSAPVVAFLALLLLIGVLVWAVARPGGAGDADGASGTDAPVTTIPTEPAPTEPAPTEPPPTEPPPTEPPPTEPPPTEPPPTEPPPTPAPTVPAPPGPPPGAAAPAVPAAAGRVEEAEALAFVTEYYELLAAGEYAITWEALSPEFREARNLTYERYVAYWRSTSIELSNLSFRSGPGPDQGRVRFDARYTTGSRVIDERDEITVRRTPEGGLIITEQRIV